MDLTPAMLSLLRRIGMRHSTYMAPLKPPTNRRAVHYLRLADGGEVKIRLVPRAQVRKRMEHWIPRLNSSAFPAILAASGRVVIEKWMPGQSLKHCNIDRSLYEESGRTLADIHQTLEIISLRDFHIYNRLQHLKDAIGTLHAAKLISSEVSHSIIENATSRLPGTAHWGLVHRDFSQDNLVWHQDRMCCIDNVDLVPGFLEEDLAATIFLWQMTRRESSYFLQGYRLEQVRQSWAANQWFWTTLALVEVVARRHRLGWPDVREPLAQLDALGLAS